MRRTDKRATPSEQTSRNGSAHRSVRALRSSVPWRKKRASEIQVLLASHASSRSGDQPMDESTTATAAMEMTSAPAMARSSRRAIMLSSVSSVNIVLSSDG